jgi:hypothetical protein
MRVGAESKTEEETATTSTRLNRPAVRVDGGARKEREITATNTGVRGTGITNSRESDATGVNPPETVGTNVRTAPAAMDGETGVVAVSWRGMKMNESAETGGVTDIQKMMGKRGETAVAAGIWKAKMKVIAEIVVAALNR